MRLVSETATTITLGWTPPAGCQGYKFWADTVRVSSSMDGSRSSVRFAKGAARYRVQALGLVAEGSFTPAVVPLPLPPPSGVVYPASYYTGPLGQANILPKRQGAFLIDFYGGIGVSWPQKQAGIVAREAQIGRRFDGLHVQYSGNETYLGVPNCISPGDVANRMEQWVHDHGASPCSTWSPSRSCADVNAGNFDQGIRNVANHFKAYGFPVMIRLWHEFDNPNLVYTPKTGPDFIAAWQRVVRLFKEQGATNAGFWWCPNEGYVRKTVNASYPGDAYVDWVGSDWYNWCAHNSSGCYSTPMHAGPATFAEVFDYPPNTVPGETSQHDLWGPKKPFVVAETGTILDPSAPSSWKGDWFRAIPAAAKQMSFLRGISFYDQDVSSAEGPAANFRVDAPAINPDPLAGFKALAADPWFNAR